MQCRNCRESLTALLDGELSNLEWDQVGSHLKDCPECTDSLNSLRLAANLTERLTPVQPSPDLWNRIEAELTPPEPEPGFFSGFADIFRTNWIPAAAFSTLAVAVVLFLVVPGPDSLDDEFQSFIERREHLQNYHERILIQGSFDRERLGRNPFSSPVSYEYQNPFRE